MRSPVTLAHPAFFAAASATSSGDDSGSALPFALADIGWLLLAAALLLVAALVLDALGRRRRRAAAVKPVPRRSSKT